MLPGHYILFGVFAALFIMHQIDKKGRKVTPPRKPLTPCNEEEYINQQREKELLQTSKPNLN